MEIQFILLGGGIYQIGKINRRQSDDLFSKIYKYIFDCALTVRKAKIKEFGVSTHFISVSA
jgi:hypothetical protein